MISIFTSNKLSQNRTFLMGIAILWIVIFHTMINLHNIVLNFIRDIGDCGVEIFLFCSGYGIYHSLSKNNIPTFYLKRLKRIFIPYIPLLFVWCCAMAIFSQISIFEILGNIYSIGIWIGLQHQYAWYIQLIVLLYLIAPIIFYLFQNIKNSQKLIILLILFFGGLSFIFFETPVYNRAIKSLAFFIGMYFAHSNFKDEKKESLFWIFLFITGIIILIITKLYILKVFGYSYYWIARNTTYPFFIPGLCLILSNLLSYKTDTQHPSYTIFYKIIEFIGTTSLELYLIHIAIFKIAYKYLTNSDSLLWIIVIIICIILSILYNKAVKFITKRFFM